MIKFVQLRLWYVTTHTTDYGLRFSPTSFATAQTKHSLPTNQQPACSYVPTNVSLASEIIQNASDNIRHATLHSPLVFMLLCSVFTANVSQYKQIIKLNCNFEHNSKTSMLP